MALTEHRFGNMRCVSIIRMLPVFIGAATALVAAAPACGQFRIIPRERLDSLANPAKAKGAEAMRFDRTRIETGPIGEDDGPKSFVFTWRNIGDKPLVIIRVKTTCGCAVVTCDRRPVKPGETDSVTVTYHPKGHPGSFARKIFLFTQLDENAPTATLELAGEVIPSARPTYAYPHARGNLLLKQEVIRFTGTAPAAESIECLNGGNDTLRIGIDTRILPPPCIRAEFSPAELLPGAIGELTVRFDPAAGRAPERIPVFIRGVGLPPGKSAVTVRIDADNNESKTVNNK